MVGNSILRSTPLQRKQQANDHRQEDDRAVQIKLLQPFPEANGQRLRTLRRVVEQGDESNGDGANGQIDVETPSPREGIGKNAANQRPYNF